MPEAITLIYISITGNTHYFIERLSQHLRTAHSFKQVETCNIKDLVSQREPFFPVNHTFFAFLPTYLEGGNGVDNGYQEILTTPFADFLEFQDNYQHCLGIIGSGNRNFNLQYCLSAKQYAERFGFPFLTDFELRGTDRDVERIAQLLVDTLTQH